MNIPTLQFRYCRAYDKILLKTYQGDQVAESKILNYIKIIESLWDKDKTKVLTDLSLICHLKWSAPFINCYVVSSCIPFADPLTIPIYKKHPTYFIDILIHELVHYLFDEGGNPKKLKKAWTFIHSKYKNEDLITQNHIPVHAIHQYLFLKNYNHRRLKREIESVSYLQSYKKSWSIVQRDGWQNIISDFVGRVNI